MKKLYTLFILSVIFIFSIHAQHFIFTPTDDYVGYQNLEEYKNHTVYQQNLTGSELILSWENLGFDFPWDWTVLTCDFGGCYSGIPAGSTMLPISDTIKGFLKLTVNANGVPGTGTVTFKVWDFKYPNQCDTVSFAVHAGVFTGIENDLQENRMQVYPNPATDRLTIENVNEQSFIKLVNHMGQVVFERKIHLSGHLTIDVSEYSPGIYFLISEDISGNKQKKKLIIK